MMTYLRPSVAADLEWLVELRAVVLRPDLERLGRFDEHRVRERMRRAFRSELTRIIVVDGVDAGSIAIRIDDDGVRWIEHFYLAPETHGRGIGGAVLRTVLDEPHDGDTRLNVLHGSAAQRLYTRHGFVEDSDDGVDVFMSLRSSGAGGSVSAGSL